MQKVDQVCWSISLGTSKVSISWVVPPPSNSHQSEPKPSFVTGILGGGTTQLMTSCCIWTFHTRGWATLTYTWLTKTGEVARSCGRNWRSGTHGWERNREKTWMDNKSAYQFLGLYWNLVYWRSHTHKSWKVTNLTAPRGERSSQSKSAPCTHGIKSSVQKKGNVVTLGDRLDHVICHNICPLFAVWVVGGNIFAL